MKKLYISILLIINSSLIFSQEHTRQDSLRGSLSHIRDCYDVTYYDLDITVDDKEKSIDLSSNTIYFKALSDFNLFQIDLAANMEIISIEFELEELDYSREFDAVFVYFNRQIKEGRKE